MKAYKDLTRNEDWSELDSATRTALAKQLEAMSEWNHAMGVYISGYQLNVLAALRSSLANRWHRLWVLFAIEGCLTFVLVVVSFLTLSFLIVLSMIAH